MFFQEKEYATLLQRMKTISFSDICILQEKSCKDPIHIFTQFFIPTNKLRIQEIVFCLSKHVENENIHTIHLLNEQMYSEKELGVSSKKIVQTNIRKRLHFQDVFTYIRAKELKGYFVLLNADIFFHPHTLDNLRKSTLHKNREMMALLRFDYNSSRPNQSKLFGPRFDSQDTWIFHSNTLFSKDCDKVFDFPFGKPGCDNKIIYLMHVLGIKVINDPLTICTYHVHSSQLRSYTIKDTMDEPWGMSVPSKIPLNQFPTALNISLDSLKKHTYGFRTIQFEDNNLLHKYISMKVANKQPFLIPRISGIENNVAVFYRLISEKNGTAAIAKEIMRLVPPMKNNAGIHLTDHLNMDYYSKRYLKAFEYCELFGGWDIQGNYLPHIFQSHRYMMQNYSSKHIFWALAMDIFHYIYTSPWTQALRGKRILLVSPFEESLREKIGIREKIYGVDLFPECTFTFLKPPQTHADQPSRPFREELNDFEKAIDTVLPDFDVALLSCGGYANPIGSYIYEKGKSAIYVGGVLQMYFGILGARWEKERPDIIKLFANSHWSRPKESEKPAGSNKIEAGCYW